MEQPALALTDLHSLTGVVALSARCRKAGIKPIGGCEVTWKAETDSRFWQMGRADGPHCARFSPPLRSVIESGGGLGCDGTTWRASQPDWCASPARPSTGLSPASYGSVVTRGQRALLAGC